MTETTIGEEMKPDELRQKLRMIISHASGGHLSKPEDVNRSTNDICVEISRHNNRIWAHAQESALKGRSPEVVTDEMVEALVALADAADKCSEELFYIVQPFLGVYREHGEAIAKARAALSKVTQQPMIQTDKPTEAMIEAEIALCKEATRWCSNGSGFYHIDSNIWRQFATALLRLRSSAPQEPVADDAEVLLARLKRAAGADWAGRHPSTVFLDAADAITTLLERERRLREALERLGSSETMTVPFARGNGLEGEELLARIDYARAALARLQPPETPYCGKE